MKESKVKWHGQDNYNMNCDIEELEKLAETSDLSGTGFDQADIQQMYDDMEASIDEGEEKGLPMGKPCYEIVFDDETQQAQFYSFVRWLQDNYDGETIGERFFQHIEMCMGE